ncbi:MAG: mandelate racemase/muconate lactonizing enzyme family protein [Patescibacteria group bacterium]
MKISKIDFLKCDAGWRPWLFIKITTDEGIVGYSECTESNGSPKAIEGAVKDLEKFLIGQDPLATEKLYYDMYLGTRQSKGGIMCKAIGGIENALLDIKGKYFKVPVYKLFGGPFREKIPVYWSHWGTSRVRAAEAVQRKQIVSLEGIADLVKETKERGFSTIKTNIAIFEEKPFIYAPGFGKTPGVELELKESILKGIKEYVRRIRSCGGDGFNIILDLNFNFKPAGYIRIAKELEEFNLEWLELDLDDPSSLKFIKDSINTPICSGENICCKRQFKSFFDCRSMDVASIDIIWNGFSQSKKISDLADFYDINVTPHNYYSHLSTYISANFAAAIPNFKTLEVDVDDVPWKDGLITEVPKIENGFMKVPEKPGWGADINEECLREHPYNK